MAKNRVQMLMRSPSGRAKICVPVAWCGAIILFLAEWYLAAAYSEIHVRTFIFFGALYGLLGALVGAVLAVLLKWKGVVFRHRWWHSERPGFLPGLLLGGYFFLYGFHCLNIELIHHAGIFSPARLVGNLLLVAFTLAVFLSALFLRAEHGGGVLAFLRAAPVPLSLVVAVNLRFFSLQPHIVPAGDTFVGMASLGVAGLVGVFFARTMSVCLPFMKKNMVAAVTNLTVAAVILWAFSMLGPSSSASYHIARGEATPASDVPKPRNIVWIVMDTARRDYISIYGAERNAMPRLKEFSRQALIFDRAISTAHWTFPAHASMFTGMYSSKHGANHHTGDWISHPMAPENLTIAEILQAKGYQTGAVVANNAVLSRESGFAQGFEYYCDPEPFIYNLFWGQALKLFSQRFTDLKLRINIDRLAGDINAFAFEWLAKRAPERPFFLFLNYMEAHNGFAFVPEPYDSMYGFDRNKRDSLFVDLNPGKIVHFRDSVTVAQATFNRAAVQRKLSYLDMNLGLLFDKLKELGLFDDAMIIVTADHGDLFGEHHSFGHQTDLYQEVLRIPLLVKYPRSERTGRSDKLVQTVDIMPEILSYIGLEVPDGVQGQPFAKANHEIISELFPNARHPHTRLNPKRYIRELKAIMGNVDGDSLKYIWSSKKDSSELFDLRNDPKELNNIIAERPEQAETLNARLLSWEKSFVPVRSTNIHRQDREKLEKRLRSLGYIK